MPGYIKVYRDLKENPIWQEKPFSKGQAWIDMMLRCNYVCKPITGYGNLKWVKRGEFVSSNYKLAEAWGWSESAVRNFMRRLEYNGMILRQSFGKCSLYFLQNYAHFQSVETEDLSQPSNAQKTHRKRTRNAHAAPNNNDNNIKELKDYLNIYIQDDSLKQSYIDFIDMRIKKKKLPTIKAIELIIKKLQPFDIDIQKNALEKSIVNGWSDVFPKENINEKKSNGKVVEFNGRVNKDRPSNQQKPTGTAGSLFARNLD